MQSAGARAGWTPFDASDNPAVRSALILLDQNAGERVEAIGNVALLELRKIALFCSRRCPPERMPAAFDWARSLPEDGVALIGGFHSPMEQECLQIALRRRLPVIVCVGRSFARIRPLSAWRAALDDKRLLILSAFAPRVHRLTEDRSAERNQLAAALADEVVFVHVDPGGHADSLKTRALEWGKSLGNCG
jgi:predicted Rossmann fold nucleotide-binding protein DprA/Smf involved in DNA uptake